VIAQPQTWHYGLVARWWAEFNTDGPEIAYYQRFVSTASPPSTPAAAPAACYCPGSEATGDHDTLVFIARKT
jgi:hypothetical protein